MKAFRAGLEAEEGLEELLSATWNISLNFLSPRHVLGRLAGLPCVRFRLQLPSPELLSTPSARPAMAAPPSPRPAPSPPAELPSDASSSEQESDGEPIVPLLAGREKRSNAGNRMRALLDEEQVVEEELFKEDEGDDEFETKGARRGRGSVAWVGGEGWRGGGSFTLREEGGGCIRYVACRLGGNGGPLGSS